MRPAVVVGIDPGVSGAVAALQSSRFLGVWDLPTVTDGQGRQRVSPPGLRALLAAIDPAPGQVILERVNAMPSQARHDAAGRRRTMGARSMFNFGRDYGVVEAVVQTLDLPLATVPGATWKARAGLTRRPKDYARTVALALFPAAPLHRKRDIGRADALLIARFGHGDG